ncbi:hypothetical protein ARAM_001443 [Aspergillus rambellii]|uniref:Uncharacterized protein n=1 Tax=Aspergillus rambellii TaxID=308745 RepID=A0A0F8XT49_9EURO|nr:hypothetical protein ARAM_001443 [Aspergillus rambellii]
MAGVKRKLDAGHGGATASGGNTTVPGTSRDSVGDIRVTRSLRSSRDARAGQNDNVKNSNTTSSTNSNSGNQNSTATFGGGSANKYGPNRPSRIITLSTRNARANTLAMAKNATPVSTPAPASTPSVPSSTRETRNSRSRAAAPAVPATSTQLDATPSALSTVPETPRAKRVKRGSVAEETPRTTRQSARLRAHFLPGENGFTDTPPGPKQLEDSPSTAIAPNTRTRNRSRQFADGINDTPRSVPTTLAASLVKSPPPGDIAPETVDVSKHPESEPRDLLGSTLESPKGTVSNNYHNYNHESPDPQIEEELKTMPTASSPTLSRKRKSLESEERIAAISTRASISPNKKPKMEDVEVHRASEPLLPNGNGSRLEDVLSPPGNATDPKVDEGSRQITEEIEESTPDNAAELTTGKAVRGGRNRGRGRGARNRTSARFGPNRRGRGGARTARSGRTGRQHDRSSDVELERSPSPSAATQKLRDRQRELDKAFRKVAAAQRLALAVLATQSERRLARDKNAHKVVPEYDEINLVLKSYLQEKQEIIRREYELKVEQENRVFNAGKEAIEERFRASARYIQEEHLLASHGEYMTFIEGRRAAEDDEHTETDGSESENERGRIAPPTRQIYRGFNSSYVRNPAGAAAYERAAFGWDDFVQRAKLGDDIDPQMKEMREAGPFAGLPADEIIQILLDATGIVEVHQEAPVNKEINPPVFVDVRPTALTALADAAAAAEIPRLPLSQATPRLSTHRALLPQPSQPQIPHAHPDPRPFVLPPPTPRGQPRRLLPAGQQILPINEQLGLPDPFASRSGPPQLPPPPGSNFHRPPLPGYLTGHHPPSLFYPPPPHPRPPY